MSVAVELVVDDHQGAHLDAFVEVDHVFVDHADTAGGDGLPLKDLEKSLKKRGAKVTVQNTKEEGYAKTLNKDADFVVIAGGDGTIEKVSRLMVGSFFFQPNIAEKAQELKAKGKTIVAISHDDRFFDVADQVIEMVEGRIRQPVSAIEAEAMALLQPHRRDAVAAELGAVR